MIIPALFKTQSIRKIFDFIIYFDNILKIENIKLIKSKI
jgi:hypothetical protein